MYWSGLTDHTVLYTSYSAVVESSPSSTPGALLVCAIFFECSRSCGRAAEACDLSLFDGVLQFHGLCSTCSYTVTSIEEAIKSFSWGRSPLRQPHIHRLLVFTLLVAPHLLCCFYWPSHWYRATCCACFGGLYYSRDVGLYVSAVFATATCPSVRLSVTRRYCIKTAKLILKLFRPPSNPSF